MSFRFGLHILKSLHIRPAVLKKKHGLRWTLHQSPGRISPRHSCELIFTGLLHAPAGTIIQAKLGRRIMTATTAAPNPGGWIPFSLRFHTRPGLKFLRLHATPPGAAPTGLGWHLLLCTQAAQPPPPRPGFIPEPEWLDPKSITLAPPPDQPAVSIIIPMHNQTIYTLQCLASIALHPGRTSHEVIVVDDASTEERAAQLSEVGGLRFHRLRQNGGFITACNEGARIARGAHLVFLNNDTQVEPGWLDALVDVFRNLPDAGLVGAKLIYPDGSLQEAGGMVWRDGSACNFGHGGSPEAPEFNYLRETDYCSGACIALPRPLFEALGGFDTHFAPAYYEDTDLAFRVRAAGRKVVYQPLSRVVHYEGRSNGTDVTKSIKRHQVTNQVRFYERWRSVLDTHEPTRTFSLRRRDRSTGRPILLVVDHQIPRPDTDAGSRNIANYLAFFVANGFSVKFFPSDLYRDPGYTPAFEAMGIEFVGTTGLNAWLDIHGTELDYVLISRAHVAAAHLADVRARTSAPVLFYGVDLLSRTLNRTADITQSETARAEAARWEKWEETAFAGSDYVFYPSFLEIDALRERFPGLRASVLPPFIYPPAPVRKDTGAHPSDRTGLLFVGGFGHPPNVDAMLWFAREVMPRLRLLSPGLRLTVVGQRPPPELQALAAEDLVIAGHVSEQRLLELYASTRVVIAPLRLGGGIKGKIVEALWHGLPVVTTPVGAEGIPEAETAMRILEPDAALWAQTVASCHDAPSSLFSLAAQGPALVARHYSEDALRRALLPSLPFLATKA